MSKHNKTEKSNQHIREISTREINDLKRVLNDTNPKISSIGKEIKTTEADNKWNEYSTDELHTKKTQLDSKIKEYELFNAIAASIFGIGVPVTCGTIVLLLTEILPFILSLLAGAAVVTAFLAIGATVCRRINKKTKALEGEAEEINNELEKRREHEIEQEQNPNKSKEKDIDSQHSRSTGYSYSHSDSDSLSSDSAEKRYLESVRNDPREQVSYDDYSDSPSTSVSSNTISEQQSRSNSISY